MFSFFGTGTAARRNADGGSDDSSTGSTRVPPVVAEPPPVEDEVIDDIDDESTVDSDNNNNNNNNVTINLVRDSIISRNTRRSYIGDLIQLFKWAIINEDPEIYDWFTAYGQAELEITFRRLEDENAKMYRERVKKNYAVYYGLVNNAHLLILVLLHHPSTSSLFYRSPKEGINIYQKVPT
jgi:hypothetical protein